MNGPARAIGKLIFWGKGYYVWSPGDGVGVWFESRSASPQSTSTHASSPLKHRSAQLHSPGLPSLRPQTTLIEPSLPHKSTLHAPSRPTNTHATPVSVGSSPQFGLCIANNLRFVHHLSTIVDADYVYWVVFASSISFRMLRISSMASFSLRTNSFSSSSWAGALTSVSANLDGNRIAVSSQLNAE